jgi:hypothetical protein
LDAGFHPKHWLDLGVGTGVWCVAAGDARWGTAHGAPRWGSADDTPADDTPADDTAAWWLKRSSA